MKYIIKVIGEAYPDNKFGLYLNDENFIENYCNFVNKNTESFTSDEDNKTYILSIVTKNIEYIYAYIYYLSIINSKSEYENSEEYEQYYLKHKDIIKLFNFGEISSISNLQL